MKIIALFVLMIVTHALQAQKYFTKNAEVSFYSKAALENIEAHNRQGVGVIDFGLKKIEFSVLMKSFQFEKALMQQHFNENYVESEKYPQAVFKGSFQNGADFHKDGTYNLSITGTLTLHGITHAETATATVTIKNGIVSGSASFQIKLKDYNIKIPEVVGNKISETIKVSIAVPSFTSLTR